MNPIPIPLVILGTGGTSRDILDTVLDINDAGGPVRYECVAFLDDNPAMIGSSINGVPVAGPLARADGIGGCMFVNGIGSPATFREKERLIASARIPQERFATIVHPTASVSRSASLGPGAVLLQHVTVASAARIGAHVVVLPSAIVSHDVVVEDYSCIAGGVAISGNVRVGRGCYIGTQASLIGGIVVGAGALVGMGSVVLRDVEAGTVVAGNPARLIRAAASPSSSASAPARLSTQSPSAASR